MFPLARVPPIKPARRVFKSIPSDSLKPSDTCDIKPLPFDFYVNNEYIIEYDGEQHFRFSGKGRNDEEHFNKTKEHDEIKNQYCFDNNIPIIRIPYTHYDNLYLEDLMPETSKFLIKK